MIRAERIGKRYDAGRRRAFVDLRERMSDALRKRFQSKARQISRCVSPGFWALKDVSFEIGRGEIVGITGHNGSGKTTLMKILARITEPSTGSAAIATSTQTLLDVGAGLHGELSGRENVFLNAAIHGMHKEEIRNNFDEIVAFAEIEKSVDQPLKYFSSGMCLRLALTVACFMRSSVLLVDEVLSQADPAFQRKCLAKMKALASEGAAILMVSHDHECVHKFCTRNIVFSAGRIVHDAPVDRRLPLAYPAWQPAEDHTLALEER